MRSRLLFALLACSAILPLRAYYDVSVTGTYSGSVWGSGPYTADSAIGKAAVHAGLISIGQVATIRVESLGTQSNFVGSVQNGIQTYSWASSWEAVSLSLAPGGGGGGGSAPTVELSAPASVTLGSSFTLTATAADADSDLVSLAIDWQSSGQIGWWTASGGSASRSVLLTNAATSPGVLYFRAEATDGAGRITPGPWVPVTVTAASNQAPAASLSAPTSAYASNSFAATASASDPEGSLAQLALVNQWTGTVQSWSVSGASATMSAFPTAPASAGTIYLRTEASDTAGATGASAWWGVAVSGPPPTLTVSPTSVSANGTVSVAYSGAYPDAWIGLFAIGGSSYAPLASGSIPAGGAGTLSLSLSPASFFAGQSYEARYFPSGSYSPSAWSNTFTVTGATTYTLTVENGSGSASGLVNGSTCAIHAGSPGPGESFWRWVLTSGAGTIQSLTSTSTVFTMHASDANVRACFTSVSVSPNPAEAGGSVSVSYSGALTTANRVTLAQVGAPDSSSLSQTYVPSAGQGSVAFSLASGFMTGVSYEARLMLDGSTVMARSAPFTLVAGTTHSVTVIGGTGSGTGLPNGSAAEIRADIPPLGQKFSHWSLVSGAGVIADPSAPLTQVTLTSGSVTVQANTAAAASSDQTIVASTSGGVVWGTDVYTTDSDKARAVVHAGLLAPGQAGVIRVHQIGNWYGFTGSLRNGIDSMSYGAYPGMRLELAAMAPTYTLTVTGGTGGGSNLAEGTVRSLAATVPAGLTFQTWTHVSGPGALSSATANPTNFTVGAGHATVQAVFLDNQPPPAPTWNEPNNLAAASVNLLWSSVSDASGISGYEVFRNGVSLGVGTNPNRWVTGLQPQTTYAFTVRAQDNAGLLSPLSTVLSVTTPPDTTPPVAPINFYASSLTPVSVVLSWAAMYDNVGVTAYVVYQNGVALPDPAPPLLSQTSRTVTALLPETSYTFQVRARDAALNLSGPSAALSVTTPADTTAPSVPGLPTTTAVTRTSLSLTWPASYDFVGVTAYELRVNGAVHSERPSTNTCTLSGLSPGTVYAIELRAWDAKGNGSDWTRGRAFTTLPPTPVVTSPLTATGTYASAFSYTITASYSPTGFSVTGLPAGLTLNASTGVISGFLPTPGTYPVTLRGHNAHGAGDPAVLSLIVTKAAPIGVGRTVYNQPTMAITAADLAAMLRHPDNPNAAAPTGTFVYTAKHVRLGTTDAIDLGVFTLDDLPGGLVPFDGPLAITVNFPGDSNYAAVSRTVVFQNIDTVSPSTPTGLTLDLAVADAVGIRWTASIDGAPTEQRPRLLYDVTTGSGASPSVNLTVERPAVWLTGLSASTSYNVRVRAKDLSGNASAWSSPLAVTTGAGSSSTASLEPEAGMRFDIDGDSILDTLYPPGKPLEAGDPPVFDHQAGATDVAEVSFVEYHLDASLHFLSSYEHLYYLTSLYPDFYYNGMLGGIYHTETIETYVKVRPIYTVRAEPLARYAVYALLAPDQFGRVLSPRVLENNPSAPVAEHIIDDGPWWEYNHYFETPQILAKLGEGVAKVRVAGSTGEPIDLGPNPGDGGTLVETQQTGVEKTIEVLDQFGRVLSDIRWHILRDGVFVATDLGSLRVGLSTAGTLQIGVKVGDAQYRWFKFVILPASPQISLAVDANRDGQIRLPHEDSSDATSATAPYRFWSNDDDDIDTTSATTITATTGTDWQNNRVDGPDDLKDFFPVFLDIKQLLDVLPHTTDGITYKLKHAEGALNFAYTSLTRATAFDYLTDTASTYGPSAGQPAAAATTERITTDGIPLNSNFLNRIKDQDQGVILVEARGVSAAPLTLVVEKSGTVIAEIAVNLLTVAITEVISDQISGNECNKLPTAYYKGEPNNPMLMATRSGVDAHLAVRIDVPPGKESLVYVGVRKIGTQTILGSAQSKVLPEKVLLQFNAIAGCETYEVVAGGDSNNNNRLDDSEAIIVFERTPKKDANGAAATAHLSLLDKVIIVTETQFQSSKSSTINNNIWGTDYAGDLISAFGHGTTSVSEATATPGIDIYANTPGLSHPVGARWDTSCHDTTYRFTFADGTEASDDFEESDALAQIIDEVIQENLGTLIAQANTTSTVCAPITFSKSRDLLETEDPLIGFNELGLAFGKVTISGSITVTARKIGASSIFVDSVAISGSFDDLYDFAYGSGGKAREAAIVQAGHSSLAKAPEPNSGKVFFTRLQFNGSNSLNKTYTIP